MSATASQELAYLIDAADKVKKAAANFVPMDDVELDRAMESLRRLSPEGGINLAKLRTWNS